MQPIDKIIQIANMFDTHGHITHIEAHGSGNINDTYLAISEKGTRYILQRVNTDIFTAPKNVMRNMRIVTQHIQQHIHKQTLCWKTQHVILTKRGEDHFNTEEESFWRMISFIDNAESFNSISSRHRAYELGKALGLFHVLMDDLPKENIRLSLKVFISFLDISSGTKMLASQAANLAVHSKIWRTF